MSMNQGGRGGNRAGRNRAGQGRSGANRGEERRTTRRNDSFGGSSQGDSQPRRKSGSRGNRYKGEAAQQEYRGDSRGQRRENRSDHQRSENRGNERGENRSGFHGDSKRNAKGHERNRKAQAKREFSAAAPSMRARTADHARLVAFETINNVVIEDSYANLVLPNIIRKYRLDHRDAGFATELTYGTLRNQGTYDAILAHCVDRPLEKTGTKILTALRIGTHQLLAMRVPSHAALNQTVALARAEIGSGPANFINAVLRRVSEREPDEWYELLESEAKDEHERLAISKSHPAWIVRAMRQALVAHGRQANEIEALLDADNKAPVVNLVALPGLGTLDEATENGAEAGTLVEDSALYSAGDLARLESVRDGVVRAQDAGSQLVARALANAPLEGSDENWLDLCAGPGGKAALLGALAAQRGATLVANEAAPHRAKLVRTSMKPLPREMYSVATGDGLKIEKTLAIPRNLPEALQDQAGSEILFDRVMVDVPCSGLGALRRRPEARWRKTPRDVAELLNLQKELFAAALSVTRPGGLVAYVTCSPHAAETQLVVSDILKVGGVELIDTAAAVRSVALRDEAGESVLEGEKNPAFTVTSKTDGVVPGSSTTAQLWPHVHRTDAMFMAIFRKK